MKTRKPKWGYGGTKTAINGLLNIIEKTIPLPSNWTDGVEAAYQFIIDYAKENGIQFLDKGHKHEKACRIARIIQCDFQPFRQYCYNIKHNKNANNGSIQKAKQNIPVHQR